MSGRSVCRHFKSMRLFRRLGGARCMSADGMSSRISEEHLQEPGRSGLHNERRLVQKEGPSFADFIQRAQEQQMVKLNAGIRGMPEFASSTSLSEGLSTASQAMLSVEAEAMSIPESQEALSSSTVTSERRLYFETYGCQMNVNDLEIVLAILSEAGYSERVDKAEDSDVILINTCAIRDKAEQKVWHRLNYFKHLKERWLRQKAQPWSCQPLRNPPKVVVLGCMAERLKTRLLDAEKMVDVVCGPDAYRDLPRLLSQVDSGQAGVNTMLSLEETYADVSPIRVTQNAVSAFVSIMRGCDNMCSYCIVPFTRGRERSRPVESIVREIGELSQQGVREVILLGQNVNSYRDISSTAQALPQIAKVAAVEGEELMLAGKSEMSHGADGFPTVGDSANQDIVTKPVEVAGQLKFTSSSLSHGFSAIYRPKSGGLQFAHLLDRVAQEFPEMRFRFTSPHPKDFPDELLEVMRERPNVCLSIHLPAQSGSTSVLGRMRRGYSREAYLELVRKVRRVLPGVALSSDFITGFCGEEEQDHLETLSLIEEVGYDMAYMFAFSLREQTHAHRHYSDNVSGDVKKRRLAEMIETFRKSTRQRYECQIGQTQLILVEGVNKRAPEREVVGKNDTGHRVVVPNVQVKDFICPKHKNGSDSPIVDEESNGALSGLVSMRPGDYVEVEIVGTSMASLRGFPLRRTSLSSFHRNRTKNLQTDYCSVANLC